MERRLAAVLVADVAGYSRLMEVDEEGTLVRFNMLRENLIEPLIQANRGRLVKLMGDGILVEFPSAVDAVRCGLEIQRDTSTERAPFGTDGQMLFRIGINLGDVIAQDGDIFGDGVNVAARLQQLGEPGSVTISDDVLHQVQNRLEFGREDLGEQRVKNLSRAIHVHRLTNEPAEKDDAPAPVGAGFGRRLAIWVGIGVSLAAAGLVALIMLNRQPADSACIDHLGLPVASEFCPDDMAR